MKIFVFDTETTWFIDKKNLNDLDSQPKIVQIAWILWDLEKWIFTKEKEVNILINPKIPIPFWSSQVHHIYDVDVKDKPYIEEKIDEITSYINDVDIIIWHNLEYDEDILKIELKRLNKEYKYRPKQTICTMKTTTNFCAIKWNWERFKYPKLWELHKKLFGQYFIGAHDALTDVKATLKCFVELVNKWIIKIEEKKEEVMSLF